MCQLRWHPGEQPAKKGKTDTLLTVEAAVEGDIASQQLSAEDLPRSLIIGTTSTELVLVFDDAETRDRWLTGCTTLISYQRDLPHLLRQSRPPWVIMQDMITAAELQAALQKGDAHFQQAQEALATRETQARAAHGLATDATAAELRAAQARVFLAAKARTTTFPLKEKVLPSVPARSQQHMTGPAAPPWSLSVEPSVAPRPIWLFQVPVGERIHGPTFGSLNPGQAATVYKKTIFSSTCYVQMIILLPRQARDKHRENSKQRSFSRRYDTWGLFDDGMVDALEEARSEGSGAAVMVQGPSFSYARSGQC
jgi:hypothetical protein